MRVVEEVEAWGHPNVTGRNSRTFEVTKEKNLTRRGDCIIAVNASKGAIDLSEAFKKLARRKDAKITVTLVADGLEEIAVGWGGPELTFTHTEDLVARKSGFTCSRTLMVGADKAAIDFSRSLIQRLKSPQQRVKITLVVEI